MNIVSGVGLNREGGLIKRGGLNRAFPVIMWFRCDACYPMNRFGKICHHSSQSGILLYFNLNKTSCRRSLGLHGIGEWAVEWPMQCGDVACWETVCYADCLGGEY